MKRKYKNKYPKINDSEWLTKQIKEKPLRQIAEEIGCSYSAIVYYKNRYCIDVPKRKAHRKSLTKSESIKKTLRERYPNGRHGKLATNWRGGNIDKHGYIYIYEPNHPNATRGGYVAQQRLIAESMLGRYLKKGEIVHHKNANKHDNRLENLEVTTRGKHLIKHFKAIEEVERLKEILEKHGIKY